MTLRVRLISVLLFLGAFMIVPLGFSIADYYSLRKGAETLAGGPSDTAVQLSQGALQALTDEVKALKRCLSAPSDEARAEVLRNHEAFALFWTALTATEPSEPLKKLAETHRSLGLDPSSPAAWSSSVTAVKAHRGSRWSEDLVALKGALDNALAVANDPAKGKPAFRAFRGVATIFRARLLGVGQGEGAGKSGLFAARVRGTSRLVLEELLAAKKAEIRRISLLVVAGALMALFFARVLWKDLIAPLERLRGSINNMAMSGTPTPVETDGPREVRDLLQAYNRLIDMIAGEAAQAASGEKKSCGKCSWIGESQDKYCASCGFPL